MKIFSLILSAWLLTGCSTHHLNTGSSENVSSYGKDITVKVTGANADIVDKLTRYIQAALLTEGFNLVTEDNATHLEVAISDFDPGNAALRLTVGFGAGRGSLVYNAKYTKSGKVLVDYDGAERFTGLEIAPGTKYETFRNFGGEETSTQILLEEASKHIVEQAINQK
ncbi:DUF4410 domain-containing protein [Methylomonas sp. MO1]|uniref:DUF4410 domain-containing protein n=1 Tax=unclassified Methylomonas TaxID=2608980 RepID=UPI0009DF0A06|nr:MULTISPECIES: DUF4410 domain-containing protein [unclassified Methylomonas]MDT4291210.1 DUF4410 domain-containing protein [Methylomonas sp. MO1]